MTEHVEEIVLGGGCFWCLEAAYQLVNGVVSVVPGYAGGKAEDADYYLVSSGKTGHAEVVKVVFDKRLITLEDILDIFWALHNPTTLNKQGADEGPQYRSVIFYHKEMQRQISQKSIEKAQELWSDPIVTALEELPAFYDAEEYHRNYFQEHPEQAYCQIVINPKLQKLREKFAQSIKSETL